MRELLVIDDFPVKIEDVRNTVLTNLHDSLRLEVKGIGHSNVIIYRSLLTQSLYDRLGPHLTVYCRWRIFQYTGSVTG